MKNKVLLIGSAMLAGITLWAKAPAENLIPDYEMENPAENWNIRPSRAALTKGAVENFNDSGETLNYVTFPGNFWLRSGDLAVRPDTEYVAELYFLNPGRITAGQPGMRLGVYAGNKGLKTVLANNTRTWKPLRLFFNSGKNSSVNLRITGSAPGISIGRITLAPVAGDDVRMPVVFNDAAKENAGDIYSDFMKERSYNDFVLTEENGEKFYRITIPAGKTTILGGKHFLMKENEKMQGSVKVRLGKSAGVRFEVNGPLGLYSRNVSHKEMQPAGKWIELVIDRALPSRRQVKGYRHIKNADTIYDSYVSCRPLLIIYDAQNDTTVDVAGLNMQVLPAK